MIDAAIAQTYCSRICIRSSGVEAHGRIQRGGTATADQVTDSGVTFSPSVSNVTSDDFSLTTTNSASANIVSVSGSGTSYTVTVDSISGDGTLRLDVNSGTDIDDGAGNAPAAYTSGTPHTVDRVAPTVTDGNLSISGSSGTGGAFKVGDTVTATWDDTATGDNNSDTISAVTVDFSAFGGGAAVAASNSSGTWTATYTITEEGGGVIDATSRNISATVTDDAGNATTTNDTTGATVDNDSPGTPTGTLAVDENSPDSTSAGTVSGGGSDGVAYSLTNNAGGRFTIDAGTGNVTVANGSLLDHESNASHEITVRATDNAGNTTDSALTVTVNDINEAPSLTGLDGDSVSFYTGGSRVSLDASSDATLTDVDSADLDGGTVTVSITANGYAAEDVLSIGDTGVISRSGTDVVHSDSGGTIIGSLSGGSNGGDLVISLNTSATPTRVQDLLHALEYHNTDAVTNNTAARNVQITVADGDGATSANQNITVSVVRAPIIDLDGDDSSGATDGDFSGSFTEGTPALVTGGDSTISDDGSYASLTVTLTSRPDGANETLSSTYGSGAQTVNGENVTISSYNSSTGELTVTADGGSTNAATMQLIMDSIRYNNTSDDPNTNNRTLTFSAVDNDGNQGSAASATISVVPVNDAPTLTATGQNPTYIEGAAAADLYSGVSADTIETTNTTDRFSSMTLTVTNLSDGSSEILRIDGTDLALTNGNTATTATNNLDVDVSVTGSTATVSVTSGSLTNAQMQTLVDSLAYRNTSDNPTTAGNRVVTITGITDNGGTDNSGSDSATPNLTSTVSLTAVNDAPVIANLDGNSVVLEPATATGIDQNGDLTLSNVDSADYNGGSLTLTDKGANNTVNGNFSVDGTHVTAGGDAIIAAGETLSVGGTAIGTIHATNDGQGGNTLEINFNGNSTNARVETLLRNLEWSAAAGTGNQTFTATLNDADGTSDGGDQDTTANFTMILGNAPVIGNLNGDSLTFTDGGSAVTIDQNTDSTLSDLDNPASFNGGSLNVSVSANKVADEDLLTFDTSGAVSLAGTTAGSNVSVSGNVVGTLANSISAGNDLVVNLNSNATMGRVQSLLQAVAYDNVDDLPTVSDRTVSVSVTDTLGISSALANITVSVTSINEAPAFTGVDATPTYTEDGSSVVLDGNMSIADPELDTLDNYDGATLTLSRADGANTNDSFGSSGTLSALTEGQTFQVGATTIGTVTTHSAGQLSLAFNTNATTSLVNAALQQITYSNASNMPASSVTIDLLFDDGNTGGQGSGPNLTDSDDSITVDIVVVNDAPQISSAGGFDPLFTAGNAAVRLFTGTVVDPIEVGQTIDEVVLTATNISDSGKEFLIVDGTDIDLTANGSTAVGSYSVTVTTGSPTRITIDTSGGNNTPSEISSLISNLDYRNDAEPLTVATRDFTLTSVTDDGGQLNGGNDTANGLTLTSTVTTTNNTAPEITSHGGASFIYIGASENQSDVTQVTATDDDGDDLTFMLSGGADQSLFDIDPLTGELAFKNPVDFESPSDQDGNNEYGVEVTVSDGRGGTDVIGFIAVVADQNDAPQIASPASPVSISENTLNVLVADVSDQDGDNLTFSISGGDDAALFTIDSSGSLRFKQSQNFEQPSDANNDGLYSVEYTVTDPEGASDSQFVTVRVSDVNEAPTIVSQGGSGSAQVYPQELGRYVMTVVGEDEDGDALSYSISGEDSELFNISPDTGILSFKTPPDFESPADADHDNAYHLTNTVTDSFGLQDSQNVVVYVQNRNEQPAFDGESVFNGPENETPVILLADHDPDGDALTYRITGGEDADAFTIHGDGTLSLKDTPDFESPTDANGDNIYRVEVEGRDSGGLYYRQNLSYTVADIAEAPVFITETSVFLVTENSTTVGMIEARDPDQNGALTYRIAGGADGSLFQMDVDGNLSFITPPDFESPQDQGSDNVYAVTVIATDIDGDESVRDFTVEVTDVEDSEPDDGETEPDIPDEAEWDTLPDDDGDGIPEQVEDFVPSPHGGSDGDGNGDGVRDKDQRSVASTPFRNTDKVTENPDAPHTFITLEVSSDDNSDPTTERAAIQQTVQRDAPNDKPGDIDMPLGLIDFTVTSRNVGQMESFSLFVDNDIRLNGYYKQNAEGQWVNIANNIEHVGNKIRIDFNIRDGGEFDEDGEANGVIVDPGALGYQAPAPVTADDQLATLYITYYDRAPDAEGYAYWKNMMEQHGWSLYDVSRGFAEHPRFAQEYAGQSDEEIAAKLYINTFGIEGEQDGIDFWTEQIGQRPLHEVIADFNVSGLNLDLTALYEQGQLSEEVYTLAYQRQSVLKNLIKTSMDFVDIFGDATIPASQADQLSGDPAYKAAIAALEQVTQDPVTAYEARDQMLALVGAADPMQGLLDLWIT